MPMNRQRSLPPDDFTREEMLMLPPEVRLTAEGLRLYADSAGRERVNARLILSQLYPLDDSMTPDQIIDHLLLLDDAGFLCLYRVGDRDLFQILLWPAVSNERKSDLPPPPPESVRTPSGIRTEELLGVERERGEGGGGESREARGEWRGQASGRSGHLPETSDLPPDPFCGEHPDGSDLPCRACGTARLRLERWQRNHVAARGPRFEPADIPDPVEFIDAEGRIETT